MSRTGSVEFNVSDEEFVNEIMLLEGTEHAFSPLEKYLLVYLVVTDFEGKRNFRKEHRLLGSSVINLDLEKNEQDNGNVGELEERLCQILNSVGIGSVICGFDKTQHSSGLKNTKKHAATMSLLEDSKYDVQGIFYGFPSLDVNDKQSSTICHALMTKLEAIKLLGNSKKALSFYPSKLGKKELDSVIGLLSNNGLVRSEDIDVDFSEALDAFTADDYALGILKKAVENFIESLYEMKAKSKSITRNKMYGEGTRPINENVAHFGREIFDHIAFEMCQGLRLNEISKNSVSEDWKREEKEISEDTKREIENDKVKAKIFSEEYEGITPGYYREYINELLKSDVVFTPGSVLGKEYTKLLELRNSLFQAGTLDMLTCETQTVELDKLERALSKVLDMFAVEDQEKKSETNAIVFASALEAQNSWNVEDTEKIGNEFLKLALAESGKKYE